MTVDSNVPLLVYLRVGSIATIEFARNLAEPQGNLCNVIRLIETLGKGLELGLR